MFAFEKDLILRAALERTKNINLPCEMPSSEEFYRDDNAAFILIEQILILFLDFALFSGDFSLRFL
jgi:hypothetical protein